MEKKFSKKEAIKFGWLQMKSNLSFFLPLFIFIFLLAFGLDRIIESVKEQSTSVSFLLNIISIVIHVIISIGMVKIALSFADGQKGKFSDLFSQYRLFFNYFLASILYNLIMIIGFILLIVPGVIWGIKYQFFSYLIVEKNLGPIDSLKKSSEITEKTKWELFLFRLLIFLVNLAGMLCFGIGLLFTAPATMVAEAFVYRKLSGFNGESPIIEEKEIKNLDIK